MANKKFSSKQPWEHWFLEFDFTKPLLDSNSVISSVYEVSVADGDGNDVTSTLTIPGDQVNTDYVVFVKAIGGTSGNSYFYTVRVIATDGEKYELDGTLPVLGRGG